jgi:hypothetical protein
MSRSIRYLTKFIVVFVAGIGASVFLMGQTPPTLGTTATYGAFTGVGGINNTGLTQLTGDIGTNAGNFTGFPPGVYTGAKHVADPASLVAKNDLTIAWNQMGAIPCDATLSVTMGNGQVLTPKTYCVGPASTITGNLTLDALGNPNAVFIIKVGGALNVAATSHIILANLAQAANVYWRIDGAVSILDNSIFKGTIVANGAIHLYGGTSLEGRALSVVGAITMASNMITVPVNAPPGSIAVIRPAEGDTIIGGMQNYQIEFTGVNVTLRKTFEYSLDDGATWNIIGVVRSGASSYPWNVPSTATTQGRIRITDSNGVVGVSGKFVIRSTAGGDGSINSLTLDGVVNNRIGNAMPVNISWTFTPDIGASVDVEYSLDSAHTWAPIATVSTSESPSVMWTTPASGSYSAAFIRVTSTKGMKRVSDAFRIGTVAAVGDRGAVAGYSVAIFPNPASDVATIEFVTPVQAFVKICIVDNLGNNVGTVAWRSFEAGRHSIPFNAEHLASGVYTYTLEVGKTRVVGMMTIVR